MARVFGDDRVEIRADGSRVLTCSHSKGWRGRIAGSQTRAEHPGAAVRWEDAIYEVTEAAPLFDGGFRYVLVAWDERHAIRAVHEYGEAAEDDRRRDAASRRAGSRKRRLSILLGPLAGHLPGRVQQRMEGDFGASARAMTAASALPLLVLGVLGLFGWFQTVAGGKSDFLPWLAGHPILSAWLVLESAVRLGVAYLLAEPIGSLAGTIGWEVWRLARGIPAESAWKGAPASADQAARDRFRLMEPLLALLSAEEQDALERQYGFDPLFWGRRSVLLLGFIGGINAFVSYGHWLAGGATVVDAVWFVAGIALLLEQVHRRRTIVSGRPAGSMLGGLVRPLARRAIS